MSLFKLYNDQVVIAQLSSAQFSSNHLNTWSIESLAFILHDTNHLLKAVIL